MKLTLVTEERRRTWQAAQAQATRLRKLLDSGVYRVVVRTRWASPARSARQYLVRVYRTHLRGLK